MKKLITILAIMMVVFGIVFADTQTENHELKITADVSVVEPAFRLGLSTSNSTAASSVTFVSDNTDPDVFTNGVTYDNDDSFDTGIDLVEGGSVYAYALLVNNARSLKSYNITFSEGAFSVTENGSAGTITPTISVTLKTGNFATITSITKGAKVTFNGKTATGGTSPIALAVAEYKYAARPNVDIVDDGDADYEATIKMAVTVE